ncbi:OLC1v1000926C1 [Oldenlandia corymbosa var. corymbosa]|uniref:OLC1v1000926C1 n=1 Tax=Oldenlandia corymbosa var. corymbosa TaxID=529605 RepID=A0AAV1D436_OLDCO|nr:OLC1v1000926C1 [Oldenlandia corymbosa var. corymbosa]
MAPGKELEKLLSMKGGNGESSYANNSRVQAQLVQSMLHELRDCLDTVQLSNPLERETPFVVADLGCSSGRNTVYIVDLIINHIIKRYEALGYGPDQLPEFSVFFSDLPSNDFNNLFQLLPTSDSHWPYFAAGVPGSFYGSLFPAKSVDVFYSAFSVHWLSRVPEAVVDKRSTAYNESKIFIHGAKESTVNAYKKQFKEDFSKFLRSRSVEIKRGGSMFLICLGRTSDDPTDQDGAGVIYDTHFEDAWDDLVHEDLITRKKRDDFNIPVYAPSLQEFKEVVEADGSFVINKLELFKTVSLSANGYPDNAAEVGQTFANFCRSATDALVTAHIGEQLSEELFIRVARRAANRTKETQHVPIPHIAASLSLG